MATIQNQKLTIDGALKEYFYEIPDYQREYVWTEREVEALLEDISEQLSKDSESDYFVGTTIVSKKSLSQPKDLEVIDGQQRLTTLFLIVTVIRRLVSDSNYFSYIEQIVRMEGLVNRVVVNRPRLMTRYDNSDKVLQLILKDFPSPNTLREYAATNGIPLVGSISNLIEAYETIESFLRNNYASDDQLIYFLEFLTSKVVFIQIETDIGNALKIFETINQRGKGLNPMDLLKNLIFRQVNGNDFSTLKTRWKNITSRLEIRNEKALRFLRYFIMSNYEVNNVRDDGIIREDELYSWLSNNDVLCNYTTNPFGFVDKIDSNLDLYLQLLDCKDKTGNINPILQSIHYLTSESLSIHMILLLSAINLTEMEFTHFLGNLETFIFTIIFSRTPPKDFEGKFSIWADQIREICLTPTSDVRESKLNTFYENNFNAFIKNKQQDLDHRISHHSLLVMQKYRTKYFIAKIAEYIQNEISGHKQNLMPTFMQYEIEHVLPKNPTNELLVSFAEVNPTENYDEIKEMLGNLTLLEKLPNIVAGNSFFTEKRIPYLTSSVYLTRSIFQNELAKNKKSQLNRIRKHLNTYHQWDMNSINSRATMYLKLSRQVWTITMIQHI